MKKCRRCQTDINDDWRFCPRCGGRVGGDMADDFGRDLFSQVFSRMKNSTDMFEDMDRMFEKNRQVIDLSPFFRQMGNQPAAHRPGAKGFTVKITRGTGMQPKVDVQTFGGVKREDVEHQVLGRREPVPQVPREEKRSMFRLPLSKKPPTSTEEPCCDIRRIGDNLVVDIDLPGVKSEESININELEASVEVKAVAGDKAYFKILTKPEQFKLAKKEFSNGRLHLEFA